MTTPIPEALAAWWRALDPKLRYTVLSAAVSWAVAKYAISLDADTSALITGVIASVCGYRVPNDATILREEHEDGNARLPEPGAVGVP